MKKILGYILIAGGLTFFSCYGDGGQSYYEDTNGDEPERYNDVRLDIDADTLGEEEIDPGMEVRQTQEEPGETLGGEH